MASIHSSNSPAMPAHWLSQGTTALHLHVASTLPGHRCWSISAHASLIAFLFFISSALLIYYLQHSIPASSSSLAHPGLLVLVPIVGVRNIFYLEVDLPDQRLCRPGPGPEHRGRLCRPAQPGLCGLLRGRRLPVGLLRLAADYRCCTPSPARRRPARPFFLPADMFYLFLFLGIVAGGV